MFINPSVQLEQFVIHSSPLAFTSENKVCHSNNDEFKNLQSQKPNYYTSKMQKSIKKPYNQKQSEIQKIDNLSFHASFQDLNPWGENDFQVIQYSKYQIQNNKKSIEKHSFKTLNHDTLNKTNRKFNSSVYQRTLTEGGKDCRQKVCSSRVHSTRSNSEYQTINTSNQQKLKWQLQMQLMARRRKKISNFLRIRHFGCMNYKLNTHLNLNISEHQNNKIVEKLRSQTQMLLKMTEMQLSVKMKYSYNKIEPKPKIFPKYSHKARVSQSIPHQKAAHTYRQSIQKASQEIIDQIHPYQQTSTIKIFRITNQSQPVLIKNQTIIVGKNCFSSNKPQTKKLLRNVQTQRQTSFNKLKNNNSNLSTKSENSYTSHSIKYKLKLLKSKIQHPKGDMTKTMHSRECVRNVADLMSP